MNLMDNIEKIKWLDQELEKEKYEIDSIVVEATKEYLRQQPPPSGYGFPTDKSRYHRWNIEGDEIKIDWDERWSHGGYDSGSILLPIPFLLEYYETKQKINKGEN